jgi:DNA repair protein RadC
MRERLLAGGGDAFLDYELLEYVLALVTPRRDTKPLAKRLIGEFGTLSAVLAATPAELMRVDGLGETGVAALKFVQATAVRSLRDDVMGRPVLSSWQAVLDYLHADMAHGAIERFRVLFLNGKNVLIRSELMAEGTVNQTPVYVREVMKRALELGATAIVLAHNHPTWP